MKLDRVTITGADDGTRPQDLVALSAEFPFVEWGILLSLSQEGGPRFPDSAWLGRLVESFTPRLATTPVRLSLHVCGRWVRSMLAGANPVHERYPQLWNLAQRVQLNFHGQPHEYDPVGFFSLLRKWPEKQFIFQLDGVNHRIFEAALALADANVAPLFDLSGGAGKLPGHWPLANTGAAYHGYAGGLGPELVVGQLTLIGEAAGSGRIWIDMEGRVRTDVTVDWSDDTLDLGKVRSVLEKCAPWVEGRGR